MLSTGKGSIEAASAATVSASSSSMAASLNVRNFFPTPFEGSESRSPEPNLELVALLRLDFGRADYGHHDLRGDEGVVVQHREVIVAGIDNSPPSWSCAESPETSVPHRDR